MEYQMAVMVPDPPIPNMLSASRRICQYMGLLSWMQPQSSR